MSVLQFDVLHESYEMKNEYGLGLSFPLRIPESIFADNRVLVCIRFPRSGHRRHIIIFFIFFAGVIVIMFFIIHVVFFLGIRIVVLVFVSMLVIAILVHFVVIMFPSQRFSSRLECLCVF